jgi:hypothetical protein
MPLQANAQTRNQRKRYHGHTTTDDDHRPATGQDMANGIQMHLTGIARAQEAQGNAFMTRMDSKDTFE